MNKRKGWFPKGYKHSKRSTLKSRLRQLLRNKPREEEGEDKPQIPCEKPRTFSELRRSKTKRNKTSQKCQISTNKIENASMFSEIMEGISIIRKRKSISLAASRSCVEYSFEVVLNAAKRKQFQKFSLWLNVCCEATTLYVSIDKENMWSHGT